MSRLLKLVVLLILGMGVLTPIRITNAQLGLDLNSYCALKGWGVAILTGDTVYHWQCEDEYGNRHDISVTEACWFSYGYDYVSDFSNYDDPYSWYCYLSYQEAPPPPVEESNQEEFSPPVENTTENSNSDTNCPDMTESVYVGGWGAVTPGDSNRIRSGAGTEFGRIGTARPGVIFDVLDGPVCADGYWWWMIDYQGTVGWTVQGSNTEDWIVAINYIPELTNIEDLGSDCVAISSATLSSTDVRNCAESALNGLPDKRLMVEFATEVFWCGATSADTILNIIANLQKYGLMDWKTLILTSISVEVPQVVGECIYDLGATLFN